MTNERDIVERYEVEQEAAAAEIEQLRQQVRELGATLERWRNTERETFHRYMNAVDPARLRAAAEEIAADLDHLNRVDEPSRRLPYILAILKRHITGDTT